MASKENWSFTLHLDHVFFLHFFKNGVIGAAKHKHVKDFQLLIHQGNSLAHILQHLANKIIVNIKRTSNNKAKEGYS